MDKKPFKVCPHCKWTQVKPQAKFCTRCGLELEKDLKIMLFEEQNYCTNCGQLAEKFDKYCDRCGQFTYIGKHVSF